MRLLAARSWPFAFEMLCRSVWKFERRVSIDEIVQTYVQVYGAAPKADDLSSDDDGSDADNEGDEGDEDDEAGGAAGTGGD